MSFINSLENIHKIKPINGNIIVTFKEPQYVADDRLIISPRENQNVARVIRCASDVQNQCIFTHSKLLVRKMGPGQKRQTCINRNEQVHVIPEGRVVGVFKEDNRMRPVGRRLLVKRMIESEQLPSGVIIPYGVQAKDQTMFCQVVDFGIPNMNEKFQNPMLAQGDIVVLDGWKESMVELGKEGVEGGYYLVVHEDDIAYVEHRSVESETVLMK